MLFGAIVASDVFQKKHDEIWQAEASIIIDDDIMVVGYKPDQSNLSQVFTNQLQTAQ